MLREEVDPYPETPGERDIRIEEARVRIQAMDSIPEEARHLVTPIQRLCGALFDIRLFPVGTRTEARVVEVLTRLEKFRVNDGTIECFVARDGTGMWSASGV